MAESTAKADTTSRAHKRAAADRDERADLVRDATRLTWAWAQTCNQVFTDTVLVMADLNRDITNSLFGRIGGGRYDRSYDRAYDRSHDRGRKGTPRERDENAIDDVSGSISHALRNTADIVARSGETFSRLYDDEANEEPSTT